MTNVISRAQAINGVGSPARIANLALALGGMLALASAMGIGRFVYTPILPGMAGALALTKTEAGWIASANFLGYLAGALMTASPRLGGRKRSWFLAGLSVGAVTLAGMGVSDSMMEFLALRFLAGVASAFVLVIGSSLVLERLAAHGGSRFAPLHFAGVGVGIAVSAAMIGVLQAADATWRSEWLAAGALALALVPVIMRLAPADRPAPAPAPVSSTGRVETARGIGWLSLCHGVFGFGYVVTATFIVAVVRAAPGGGNLLPLAVWLVVGLAAIPSTAIWDRIGNRAGAWSAYGCACVLEALGVAVGGLWPNAAGALIAAVLLGGTFMGITALGFAAARTLSHEQQRRSFARITVAFGAGQIAGPVVAGWMIDRTGSFVAPSLIGAAALMLAAGIAIWTAARLARPDERPGVSI